MTLLNLSKKDEAHLDRIAEATAPALARLYASALRGLARFEDNPLSGPRLSCGIQTRMKYGRPREPLEWYETISR
jgi:hypothetical protein